MINPLHPSLQIRVVDRETREELCVIEVDLVAAAVTLLVVGVIARLVL